MSLICCSGDDLGMLNSDLRRSSILAMQTTIHISVCYAWNPSLFTLVVLAHAVVLI